MSRPCATIAGLVVILLGLAGCASRPRVEPTIQPTAAKLRFVGEIKGQLGSSELSAPVALAFDLSNNLYILDRGNNRLVKLNADYSFAQENGGYGLGINGLNNPVALTSDGGIIFFVLDQGNSRVVRSDYNLVFSDEVRFSSSADLQGMGKIAAIGYSRFGNMYLVDPDNLKVVVLDKDYARQQELFPAGGFAHCEAIQIAASGDVWVYDSERNSLYVFDSFGNSKRELTLDAGKIGGFVVTADWIFATDSQRNELVACNLNGERIARTGTLGAGSLNFSAPTGVALRPDGQIFICDTGNNRIVIYEIAAALP